MRLNEFLSEGRSKSVNEKKFIQLLNEKCSDAYNSKSKIYRGVSNDDDFLYVDPSKSKPRPARNAYNNIYNLIFSNHKTWAKYPKRDMSIVCSTSEKKAARYNNVYVVYPFDGAKIGVCPEEDLWQSFKNNFDMSLNGVTADIEYTIDDVVGSLDWTLSYSELIRLFDMIDKNIDNVDKLSTRQFLKTIGYLKNGIWTKKKFIDCITDKLNPDKNGFDLKTAGDKLPNNREVWTDTPCVLVNAEYEIE